MKLQALVLLAALLPAVCLAEGQKETYADNAEWALIAAGGVAGSYVVDLRLYESLQKQNKLLDLQYNMTNALKKHPQLQRKSQEGAEKIANGIAKTRAARLAGWGLFSVNAVTLACRIPKLTGRVDHSPCMDAYKVVSNKVEKIMGRNPSTTSSSSQVADFGK